MHFAAPRRYSGIALLVLALSLITGFASDVDAQPMLTFLPDTSFVSVGDTFDVALMVDAFVDTMSNFDVVFAFDPTVLEFVSAAEGSLYTSIGWQSFFNAEEESLGTWEVFQVIFPFDSFILPPGELAIMTFRAVGDGATDLFFRSATITDIDRLTIPGTVAQDGHIVVSLSLTPVIDTVFTHPLTSQPVGATTFIGELSGTYTVDGFVIEGTTSIGTPPIGIDHQTGIVFAFGDSLDNVNMRYEVDFEFLDGLSDSGLTTFSDTYGLSCHFCNAVGCGVPEGCATDVNTTVRLGYRVDAGGLSYYLRDRPDENQPANYYTGKPLFGDEATTKVTAAVEIVNNTTAGYLIKNGIVSKVGPTLFNPFTHRQWEAKGEFWPEGRYYKARLSNVRCMTLNAQIPTDVDQPGTTIPAPQSVSLAVSPNPFNPVTTISYDVPVEGPVDLRVYDVSGRLVATLINGEYHAQDRFAIDYRAENAGSGIYFVRVDSRGGSATKKLVLIR